MPNAAGHNWFITEKLEATVAGAEGELPVAMPAGSALICLDAVADGRELSIENWHDGAIASISEAVPSDRLQWS